ncbi:MAG: MaoC family dehydratase [Rhodospirillaceae bacterium]|nr:MaoC family dehydratase [Rhodospirillaceae bacterium]
MAYREGDILFDATVPGAGRAQLADFSAGTEDPNPIHTDETFAKAAGFPTVLQQGPMTTAHFARLLAEKVGQGRLRWLDVTFTAPVFPEEDLRIEAVVTSADGGQAGAVTCALTAAKSDGTVTARAEAGFAA